MKISVSPAPVATGVDYSNLRKAAVELEATFLSEILKSAGLGAAPSGFGGGVGEEQFSSLLVQQQARQMALSGGVGLSEVFFRALTEDANVA